MSNRDGLGSKCSILNGQVIYVEILKLNIADMWLVPLDHVTYAVADKHINTYWFKRTAPAGVTSIMNKVPLPVIQ